ncbi:TIR domain-containing protein [Mucilaginibacter celer]|uniref:TIR domain-containing protein n=1 Tax=Mucilaginibacter celer TaxID=2305508 RepID=A0A494VVZ1_9SPHI|nr:TIR domain-containing protein [Mucilaginibacter celer]AYL97650.1 TIR domain-containing protein [Mucilaginibacter celer]
MSNSDIPNIFISYSHYDKSYKTTLEHYLKILPLNFNLLSDDLLTGADEWKGKLDTMRESADIFLLLVSPDYLSSETVRNELAHIYSIKTENRKILPVILKPCNWKGYEFSSYQVVPKFGEPVSTFMDFEAAYKEIVTTVSSFLSPLNPRALWNIGVEIHDRTGTLDLSSCNLEYIPELLWGMDWISKLILKQNLIQEIYHLDNMVNLEVLDLSKNQIKKIENLNANKRLSTLYLSDNSIVKIESLSSLISLVILDLGSNNIEEINGLSVCVNLKALRLSYNQIKVIANISQLKNLKSFYISHNLVEEIEDLESLHSLNLIHLTDNKLVTLRPLLWHIQNGLPVYYDKAENLPDVGITIANNNLLAEPPPELVIKGNEEIIRYFEEADRFGLNNVNILKLVLVGNSRAGKTNFSEFIRTNKITLNSTSTDLLDIQFWRSPFNDEKGGQAIQINIFDFGGQDYYHDAHKMFYSSDTAYILLWDQESNHYEEREDADNITYENYPLEYWLESIKYNLSEKSKEVLSTVNTSLPPVLIIQNKIDLAPQQPTYKRQYVDQQRLAKENDNIWGFFDISLLTGKRTSILLEVLGEFIKSVPLAGRNLLSYEHEIVLHYLKKNKELKVMSIDEFWRDCKSRIKGPTVSFKEVNARVLAHIMNNMGIVYFDQKDKIYTDVARLNVQIKKIMELAKKGQDKGIFYDHQLVNIPFNKEILELLAQNSSIIKIGPSAYLAPQFLPVKPEARIEFFLPAFRHNQVRFMYDAYFHKNILLRLFSKYLEGANMEEAEGIKNLPFWRNGIMIANTEGDEKKIILIEFEKNTNCGIINMRTLTQFSKHKFEGDVMRTLEQLNAGCSVKKMISVNSRQFFEVNWLKEQVNAGQYVFYKDNNTFSINGLKHMEHFERVPKKLFISYSSANAAFVKRFITHLQVLKNEKLIEPWYDRMIEPGTKWDDTIRQEMKNSDLIVFLLSPDFLATQYIMETEIPLAIDQFSDDYSKFFFIELHPSSWRRTKLSQFQQTSNNQATEKNVTQIKDVNADDKWLEAIEALRTLL